jgi:membrane associated rhomboid family serine protease
MEMSITLILVLVTVGVSLLAFNNAKIMGDLIFDPVRITNNKQYYRFITSGFIHADFPHLIFNMLSLFMFGKFVEDAFVSIFQEKGKILYLLMYFTGLIVSLLPTYQKNKNNSQYLGLGASGAVSSVVFAGLLLAPTILVGLYFIPPIIPGFIFGPIYLLISTYLGKQSRDNINHSAHIFGALFGLAFVIATGYLIAHKPILSDCLEEIKQYLMSKGIL